MSVLVMSENGKLVACHSGRPRELLAFPNVPIAILAQNYTLLVCTCYVRSGRTTIWPLLLLVLCYRPLLVSMVGPESSSFDSVTLVQCHPSSILALETIASTSSQVGFLRRADIGWKTDHGDFWFTTRY
jgi:hypothetical protein